MLKPEIEQYIKEYNEKNGYDTSKVGILESLREDTFLEETSSKSRWWTNIRKVAKIEDRYFEFMDADATGDHTAHEAGWEFEWESVREVFPRTKTITVYE